MTYSEIRPLLSTGDVLLFSGKGLLSGLIKLFSSKSHIGQVVKAQWGELFLLESDWGEDFKGVQLTPLGEKLRSYKGRVWVRRLFCARHPAWYQVLNNHIAECRRTTYEKGAGGVLEMLAAALDFWPFNNRENGKRKFCSEKVAAIFKSWHYLPAEIPANEYTPGDFDEGGKVDELMAKSPVKATLGLAIEIVK